MKDVSEIAKLFYKMLPFAFWLFLLEKNRDYLSCSLQIGIQKIFDIRQSSSKLGSLNICTVHLKAKITAYDKMLVIIWQRNRALLGMAMCL